MQRLYTKIYIPNQQPPFNLRRVRELERVDL